MNTHSVTRDERGAILIIGLLGSVILIGFLWMIIRLGDTIALRQHAAGAADSVAFSVAVVHARSMNFIVLFNMLMTAILTVRIVLRVLDLVAVVLALPTFGASLAAIPEIEAAMRATTPPIVAALDSLGAAAGAVATSMPSVSRATANYIALSYRPAVTQAIVTSGGQDAFGPVLGLPIQQDATGTEECGRSVQLVGDLIRWPLDKIGLGGVAKLVTKVFKTVIGGASPYFCALGVNVDSPTIPGMEDLQDKTTESCTSKLKEDGTDTTTADGQKLLQECVDAVVGPAQAAADGAVGAASDVANEALGLTPPTSMRLIDDFRNGATGWQVVSVVTVDTASVGLNGMVSLSGFGRRTVADVPAGVNKAVAQAEFYFDCEGRWKGADCGGPADPIWNFGWRARLVPVDVEGATVKAIYEPLNLLFQAEASKGGQMPDLARYPTLVVH